MTKSSVRDAQADQPVADVPKLRRCLRCRAEFESEWPGMRICTRCKTSSSWHNGNPVQSHPVARRR